MNTEGGGAIPSSLHRLARARGVQVAFTNNRGHRVPADPEAVLAALRALGSPVRMPADCEDQAHPSAQCRNVILE